MCRFIETVRIVEGKVCNSFYHEARMNATLHHFHGAVPLLRLSAHLSGLDSMPKLVKWRFIYDRHGIYESSFAPYRIRTVRTLQTVCDDTVDYTYKSVDRTQLLRLKERQGNADEILIVKDGYITDTSYTNVAFWNGSRWITPKTPLLRGTMRAYLLDKGLLTEQNVRLADLHRYSSIALFNAMIDLEQLVLPLSSILPPATPTKHI